MYTLLITSTLLCLTHTSAECYYCLTKLSVILKCIICSTTNSKIMIQKNLEYHRVSRNLTHCVLNILKKSLWFLSDSHFTTSLGSTNIDMLRSTSFASWVTVSFLSWAAIVALSETVSRASQSCSSSLPSNRFIYLKYYVNCGCGTKFNRVLKSLTLAFFQNGEFPIFNTSYTTLNIF